MGALAAMRHFQTFDDRRRKTRSTPDDLLIVGNQPSGSLGLTFASRAARIVDRPIVVLLSAADAVRPEVLSAIPIVDVAHRPWHSPALALMLRRHLGSDPRSSTRHGRAGNRAATPSQSLH
ncbi:MULTISPECIES: hypothetical protein [Methylobacterium]|uniref:hypothetical protein n=1 Tax=Methylobacterium TaxID=407 RepID=UPI0013EDA764|nr:hypothetical protein [Methylobacterium sp. DB0501]NGM38086.1 hypothetical protein [Methylobacterium sp. DB0501]